MKTITSKTFIFAALFVFLLGAANAQTDYIWDHYGIGFSVTEDFAVTESTEANFTAVSSEGAISVSISPWKDASITEDDLAEATVDIALELEILDDQAVEGDYITIDTFSGYFIVAAPIDGGNDMTLMALLLDQESETNMLITISYEYGNIDEALDILNSFHSY